jgi:hypothetical protein
LLFAQKLCETVGIVISATVPGLSMSSTTVMPTNTPMSVVVVTSRSGIATSTISHTNMGVASVLSTQPMASESMTGSISAPITQFTGGAGHLSHDLVAAVVAVGAFMAIL